MKGPCDEAPRVEGMYITGGEITTVCFHRLFPAFLESVLAEPGVILCNSEQRHEVVAPGVVGGSRYFVVEGDGAIAWAEFESFRNRSVRLAL